MPFYKYTCKTCGQEFSQKVSVDDRDNDIICKCGGVGKRLLAKIDEAVVTEIGDKYRNKSIKRNIKNILKKRSRDYMKKNIGKLIEEQGIDNVNRTTLLKDGKKINDFDEK